MNQGPRGGGTKKVGRIVRAFAAMVSAARFLLVAISLAEDLNNNLF